ncbi:hypothetical protein ACFOZ1_07955 [Gracilibacillus marinus]|uniref:Uncharacterized protein n=1 Tax=Gracilibacillus marinus TaxID=630535 RepID=A0ABV8VUY2_9BACI
MQYTKMNDHTRMGNGNTSLVYSDTYKPVFLDGGILSVTTSGYTLTNKAGEVVESGSENDPLQIIKALGYSVKPLTIKDDIRGVTLPYETYQLRYDFGNVVRDKDNKRKFFAVLIKDEDNGCTGIGITEKKEGLTYAVHSVYIPEAMNKFDRAQYLVDYVNDLLFANEVSYIQAIGANYSNVKDRLNKEHTKIEGAISSVTNIEEAEGLALDAMKRKSSISEVFSEPIKYKKGGN